jgi:hypothetical protein
MHTSERLFSSNQFIEAAKWWASNMAEGMFINQEQTEKFIKILAAKIAEQPIQNFPKNVYYISIGDMQSWGLPKIIVDCLKEIGITREAFFYVPFKTGMRIYNNGQISVNGKVIICTDPNIKHYNAENTNFNYTPYMRFKGNKFRIVEIKLNELTGDLYEYFDHGAKKIDEKEKKLDTLFVKFEMRNFNGSEKEFQNLSDEDLIKILQDPNKFRANFKNNFYLYYEKDKKEFFRDNGYSENIGKVIIEDLGNNYYQEITDLVRVMTVPQTGTLMVKYVLITVNPGDFLLARKDEKELNCYRDSFKEVGFAGYLCDSMGNILSDKPYYPGEELPQLSLTERVKKAVNIQEESCVIM